MKEIKNAEIKDTMLGYEDRGILTAMLYLDYGGSGQGFGGWSLDGSDGRKRVPSIGAGLWIAGVLRVLGVDAWEKVKGQHCRVEADYGKVYRIGHFLEDKWFDPAEAFAANQQAF